MKRLEFHISYICPHNCIFCSEYDRMKQFEKNPLSKEQVKVILIDRRKKGFNHINFTWWEPTLFPSFLEILSFAKKLWYTIYVGTNGSLFYSKKFSQEALKYIDELSLSVHWYDNKTCEKQTGNKHHFTNFSWIIENINTYKNNNFFFLNIVINKYNYKDTLRIIKFVINSWYPFQQVLISNIAPEWIARHNFKELVFDLYDFKNDIPDIIKISKDNKKILRFFWMPLCMLWEEFKEYSNDAHWEERNTIERLKTKDGKIILKDVYSFNNSRERCFVKKCKECKWKANPCTW